jgi:phenylacetate-CoA ligase
MNIRKLLAQITSNFYVRQLQRNQWQDQEYLKRSQLKKIKAIIKYAYDYVPYYHRLFRSIGFKPGDIKKHEDLKKIPPISKQDIRENYQDFIARGLDASKLPSSFTSGSTGIPLKIVYDHSALSFYAALGRYIFSQCGVKPNYKFVTIWGRAQSIIWNRSYAKIFKGFDEMVVPALFEEAKLVNVLRQINPDVIYTFPSILTLLANSDVSGIRPRLILTQGETVTRHCRDTVKKAFNLELFDTYGSVEFEFLAFECNEHRGLHMITGASYIEFIEENGEHISTGEEGEIIVTGLYNRAMPLIRYRIGDVGIPTDEKCPCGRSWPLIKSINGRLNEFLTLPSSKKLSWTHFYHHFYIELEKNVFCVRQYQIIQDRKNRIIFKVTKGQKFDQMILERIKNNLESYFIGLGEKMNIVTEVVEEIPPERTGKRRIFISKLNQVSNDN